MWITFPPAFLQTMIHRRCTVPHVYSDLCTEITKTEIPHIAVSGFSRKKRVKRPRNDIM